MGPKMFIIWVRKYVSEVRKWREYCRKQYLLNRVTRVVQYSYGRSIVGQKCIRTIYPTSTHFSHWLLLRSRFSLNESPTEGRTSNHIVQPPTTPLIYTLVHNRIGQKLDCTLHCVYTQLHSRYSPSLFFPDVYYRFLCVSKASNPSTNSSPISSRQTAAFSVAHLSAPRLLKVQHNKNSTVE